jgi:hypothetical protein
LCARFGVFFVVSLAWIMVTMVIAIKVRQIGIKLVSKQEKRPLFLLLRPSTKEMWMKRFVRKPTLHGTTVMPVPNGTLMEDFAYCLQRSLGTVAMIGPPRGNNVQVDHWTIWFDAPDSWRALLEMLLPQVAGVVFFPADTPSLREEAERLLRATVGAEGSITVAIPLPSDGELEQGDDQVRGCVLEILREAWLRVFPGRAAEEPFLALNQHRCGGIILLKSAEVRFIPKQTNGRSEPEWDRTLEAVPWRLSAAPTSELLARARMIEKTMRLGHASRCTSSGSASPRAIN